MNLLVLGILRKSAVGLWGAILIIVSHGVSSPGLFTIANSNYEQTRSRNLLLNKGISTGQPPIILLWFLLISANMAAPPSLNLVSEIIISMRVLKTSFLFGIILGCITFLGGAYNLYIYSSQLGNKPLILRPPEKTTSIKYISIIPQAIIPYFLFLVVNICVCK
jgi:NADH:ubiquinone oxidoreductase subunit 4 (subunit M)